MPVPTFQYERVVDLTRPLTPGREQHPWFRYETAVESIANSSEISTPVAGWYVVTQLTLSGHAGTHIEAPFHAVESGATVGDLPMDAFFGEAVVLDLSDVTWSQAVGLARIQDAADRAGGVREGDIVLLRFDWDRRNAVGGGYPAYPAPDALRWLVDQGIKLVGIDSPGLEEPGNPALVNHHTLFDRGIPLIESLVNLEIMRDSRVYLFAVPLPAFGTDAVPLRVLAFEG